MTAKASESQDWKKLMDNASLAFRTTKILYNRLQIEVECLKSTLPGSVSTNVKELEVLLNKATPKTNEELQLSFAVNFFAIPARTDTSPADERRRLVSFLRSSGRACLVLFIDGAAIEEALDVAGLLEIRAGAGGFTVKQLAQSLPPRPRAATGSAPQRWAAPRSAAAPPRSAAPRPAAAAPRPAAAAPRGARKSVMSPRRQELLLQELTAAAMAKTDNSVGETSETSASATAETSAASATAETSAANATAETSATNAKDAPPQEESPVRWDQMTSDDSDDAEPAPAPKKKAVTKKVSYDAKKPSRR
jgi:hypothetical protein